MPSNRMMALEVLQSNTRGLNMNARRPRPRIVIQKGNESCWAAALESWLDSVGDSARKQSQEQLLIGLPDQAISVSEFRNLAAGFGMDTKIVAPVDFRADHLEMLLKTKSTLFIGFELQKYTVWWHDVVLYGVSTNPRGEPRYEVMDPAIGYRTFRRADFFPAGPDEPVLLGWKATQRAGKIL